LRNPLAPVRNTLEILRLSRDDGAAVDRSVAVIDRQITKLSRLVDDLLDISRISHRRIELRKETIDLCAIVPLAIESVQAEIDAQVQKLTVALPAKPVYVEADPTRLEQIISNLLQNASKYGNPKGHVALS